MSNSMTTEEAVAINYYNDRAESLNRLYEDKDFQKVILEGYFKDEAVRLSGLLAHDEIRRQNLRPEIMEKLVAISNLQDYFRTIHNMAVPAYDDEDETAE